MLNMLAVSVETSHTIAVSQYGNLYTWGRNKRTGVVSINPVDGQLGDGSTIDRRHPVLIMDNMAPAVR